MEWINVGTAAVVDADEFCAIRIQDQTNQRNAGWCIVGWLKTEDDDITGRSIYLTPAVDKARAEEWMADVQAQLAGRIGDGEAKPCGCN